MNWEVRHVSDQYTGVAAHFILIPVLVVIALSIGLVVRSIANRR
jgi:hypothetical protein